MKYAQNDGRIEENAVQNRFTAYLKLSVERNTVRYITKHKEKRLFETAFNEYNEHNEIYADDPFEQLLSGEIGDMRLQQALSRLREQERLILFQYIFEEKPLKLIAEKISMPYPTVKSIYRRTLEKLRKELRKE